MTQEEKQLLLKDLCARLPFGLICACTDSNFTPTVTNWKLISVNLQEENAFVTNDVWNNEFSIENLKPYLRLMSSMTEEERLELSRLTDDKFKFYLYTRKPEIICYEKYNYLEGLKVLDWLNAHHFDYRGLIERGLAIEAALKYTLENLI